MNPTEYIAKKNVIIKNILKETDIYADDMLNRTFNFVSANLLHFLPEVDTSRHEMIFRNIILNKQLSTLEQHCPWMLDLMNYEGLTKATLKAMKKKPAIICTFHMGSNRMLSHFLGANKIPFSVVMANHIADKESAEFINIFAEEYKDSSGHDLHIIEAQRPQAALRMIRDLKQGRSLLVYMDGNTGAGDNSIQNENRCKIDFLQQSIYARKGIGYISHMANVPVIPAFSYRKTIGELWMKFFSPIFPDTRMDRGTYAESLIPKVYDLFIPTLRQYPEQWECWIYLHTIADTKSFVAPAAEMEATLPLPVDSFRLNAKEFGLFNINDEKYLFNKKTYNSYPLEDCMYQLLFTSAQQPIKKEKVDAQLFKQLYDNYVLVNS